MERVVGLVNKLQQICTALGDNAVHENSVLWNKLISIVVIGGQSSGKSSVLEAVVGRDFLPRGTGIVTRRPLVLQLVKSDDASLAEYGEFAHRQGQRYYNFDEIRQEIEAETDRHLAGRRVVSPDPIYLSIVSPTVPNLTLIDMPGLTKVPIDGQPASIVQDLDDMARKYIRGPNAIVLAVSPANADLATSDALRLAREVDPAGERTIGVLTKVDIMDRGTDCRDVLLGKSVRLRHGWVAVVNRAQADINSKVSMRDARSREADFFRSSPLYRDLPNVGVGHLSDKLSAHLIGEIMRQLPSMQAYIESSISAAQRELEVLGGDAVGGGKGAMMHAVLSTCQKAERAFERIVDGGSGGGEKILEVFDGRLKESVDGLPFDRVLSLKNVRSVVNEADGYQPHIIAPENGYRRLIEEGLALLREPALRAVEQTHQILKHIVLAALSAPECRDLQRFAALRSEILTHASQMLDRLRSHADAMARTLVDMEASYLSAGFFREIVAAESYIYNSGPNGSERPKPSFLTLSGDQLFDRRYDHLPPGEAHLQRIADHVSAYLQVVRSQLLATVPKAVVHCLVLPAKSSLLQGLQQEVAGKDEPALRRLLSESEEVAAHREHVRKRLALLQRAAKEIAMCI